MPKAILSTAAPFGYEMDTVRFLEAFKSIGCTSCQFFRNPAKPPTVAEALAISQRVGLPFDSIHGLFGPDLDPSSPDPAQREHCLKVYEEEGRLARDLGGPLVVVHPSRSSIPSPTPPPQMPVADARREQRMRWPHLDDFLRRLAEVAHRLSVTYLIENLMYDCPLGHDPVQLAERVMDVRSPLIRMCFDTGHAHATLAKTSPAGAAAVAVALRVCSPAVAYLHIHDNNTTRDAHLLPGNAGEGGIDWPLFGEALKLTECHAPRMLEVFEDPLAAGPAEVVKDRLRGWLGISVR